MGKLLNKFVDIFFEEEEVVIEDEVKEEVIVKKEATPVVETTEKTTNETKKTTYINIGDDFHSTVPDTTEKIKVDPSAFIQNDKKTNYTKTRPNRAVEYEFTPVLSPIFGVVSNDRKKIKVYPDSRKTELLQPKESILGAGIRPYSGIVENEKDVISIPFVFKNGNRREEETRIEKIDIADIVQSKTRMSRHEASEENKMIFTENGEVVDFGVQEQISNPVPTPLPEVKEEFQYSTPEIKPEEVYVMPTPIVEEKHVAPFPMAEEIEPFDESTIIVKEKPFFFQKEQDNDMNQMNHMQDIDDEDTIGFEEEDINLFNME